MFTDRFVHCCKISGDRHDPRRIERKVHPLEKIGFVVCGVGGDLVKIDITHAKKQCERLEQSALLVPFDPREIAKKKQLGIAGGIDEHLSFDQDLGPGSEDCHGFHRAVLHRRIGNDAMQQDGAAGLL